jgi:hypothetical protein
MNAAALLAGTLLASAPMPGPAAAGEAPREAAGEAPREAAGLAARTVVFEGACDASGAVPLGGARFLVGDDEDNVLRVYDARRGGPPLAARDLSNELELPAKKRAPEADIEAGTGVGPLAFWLTSHGLRKSGKPDPARFRFFATTRPAEGAPPTLVGRPYSGLVDDLLAAPGVARLGLGRALALPPDAGGVNIEGMTASPDGSVLLGLRSPLHEGKAVTVPLRNPEAVIRGERARFGDPVLLDLGGRGIRSISWWSGRYLVMAGALKDETVSRLYTWAGGDAAPRPVDADFSSMNPEAFVSAPELEEILVLSDDGTALVDGVPCKRLKDAARKRFRGVWLRLP